MVQENVPLHDLPSADACAAAVERHLDKLFDVVALLDAAVLRIDDAAQPPGEEEDQDLHNTKRLVQMAVELVKAANEDFFATVPFGVGRQTEVSNG